MPAERKLRIRRFMKSGAARWLLFAVLLALCVFFGLGLAQSLWIAGKPPEPPDVKVFYAAWANVYGILFLFVFLGTIVIFILNIRWQLRRKRQ
jgi:hypothetical protein